VVVQKEERRCEVLKSGSFANLAVAGGGVRQALSVHRFPVTPAYYATGFVIFVLLAVVSLVLAFTLRATAARAAKDRGMELQQRAT
jgi:hypothetical protein